MKKILRLGLLLLLFKPIFSFAVEVLVLSPEEGSNPNPTDAGTMYVQNLVDEFRMQPGVNVTVKIGALGGTKGCTSPIRPKGGTGAGCTPSTRPLLTLSDITGYDVVVAMSIYDTPRPQDIETLRQGIANKTSSAFLFFFDTCCTKWTDAGVVKDWTNAADNLTAVINTAANNKFVAAIDSRHRLITSNPLNSSNPYAGDFVDAGSPPFFGQHWSAFKVPSDYVLYKAGTDVTGSGTPGCSATGNCTTDQSSIASDLAYGVLVPQSISPGACTFVTTDSSGFDNTVYPWNKGRMAPGFIAATTSLGGMWNNQPIQTAYDASTFPKVRLLLSLESTQTAGWRGDVVAYDAPGGANSGTVKWRASSKLAGVPHANRNIFTTDGTSPAAFDTALSLAYKTALATASAPSLGSVDADELVGYLRGDTTNEGSTFRARHHRLGPVFNSRFALDNGQDYGWSMLPSTVGSSYTNYVTDKKSRAPMLFVGMGDGMVHAFNASPTGGNELFAYVPKGLIGKLKSFADPLYSSLYQIDAPVALQDIHNLRRNGNWRTVLLGTLGGDAAGVFALDVTDPISFSTPQVLWDRTKTDAGYNDASTGLGIMYEPPVVSRLANGRNVAVFGNGFTGESEDTPLPTGRKAALYVVDMDNGNVIQTIAVGSAHSGGTQTDPQTTGLGAVTLVAGADGQSVAYAYAGDLRGNLWRFDLTDSSPSNWTGTLVAKATSSGGGYQSILTAPEVALHPDGGRIVYFGTGRRRALTKDETDFAPQSFYAVRDVGSTTAITRSTLASRTIVTSSTFTADFRGVDREVVSINAPAFSWSNKNGWVLDLQADALNKKPSERVLFSPALVLGQVVFTTATPVAKPCESSVTNRQYSLSAFSGRPVLNDIAIQVNGAAVCTGGNGCAGIGIGGGTPEGVDLRFGKVPNPEDCGKAGKPACPTDSCPTSKPVASHGVATACAKDGISRWFQLQ